MFQILECKQDQTKKIQLKQKEKQLNNLSWSSQTTGDRQSTGTYLHKQQIIKDRHKSWNTFLKPTSAT